MLNGIELTDRTHLLRELRHQYVDVMRAEVRLVLQMKASCRRFCGGDKEEANKLFKRIEKGEDQDSNIENALLPFFAAQEPLAEARNMLEKQIVKATKDLPALAFVEGVKGFGLASFGAVIGEAGDLSGYATPWRLWKRMGLAVMPDGTRQRRVAGADAILHGYAPQRRSLVWNIGDCLLKLQSGKIDEETGEILKEPGYYRTIYNNRKEFERQKNPEITDGWAHNRAKRYMEKELILDLWRAWRRDLKIESPGQTLSEQHDNHARRGVETLESTPQSP